MLKATTEEITRLRQLEMLVVQELAHRLNDGDDKTAEQLVHMVVKELENLKETKHEVARAQRPVFFLLSRL
jgi:ABC-type hemin transport system substrate-binding protein